MPSTFSIKLGDFLYKNVFPVYNVIYPYFKRRQDKQEIALMKKYIRTGDVVLDIGANIGFYTKILSELVGESGKVYAFEPDKTNYGYLMKNAGHLKNVVFFNKAVSDKTGKITLYHSDLLNVDHKTYATENYTSTTEIDCVAIDDVVPGHKVDFIKIDIQGFEYFAFKGMENVFAKMENLKIVTEFYPYGIKKSGVSSTDFINLLLQYNFKISTIEEQGLVSFNMENIALYENKEKDTYLNLFLMK
ncbi:MAG TPA: FkbM family methyltransferase [Chitinophagales bacterium]|nr:FkbM family methyltransferase [Chitinophagales bacterium]